MAVVFRRGVPVVVAPGTRHSSSYKAARQAIDTASSYRQAVEALERAVAAGEVALALDFSPSARYAQKFINTTGLYQTRDPHLAARAWRALAALLLGAGKPGRRAAPPLTEADRRVVRAAYDAWRPIVDLAWPYDDFAAEVATAGRLAWTLAQRRALMALRHSRRPCDVVAQLTAWQLELPVRRVRAARRTPSPLREVVSA